jgi:hypothetical protein
MLTNLEIWQKVLRWNNEILVFFNDEEKVLNQ